MKKYSGQFVNSALSLSKDNSSAAIIGGGDGGVARECLLKGFDLIDWYELDPEELSHVEGLDENNKVKKIRIYSKKSKVMNLAFDVTPAKYVTGLITEKGICEASKEGLKKLFK